MPLWIAEGLGCSPGQFQDALFLGKKRGGVGMEVEGQSTNILGKKYFFPQYVRGKVRRFPVLLGSERSSLVFARIRLKVPSSRGLQYWGTKRV